jgi:hypothetical protein
VPAFGEVETAGLGLHLRMLYTCRPGGLLLSTAAPTSAATCCCCCCCWIAGTPAAGPGDTDWARKLLVLCDPAGHTRCTCWAAACWWLCCCCCCLKVGAAPSCGDRARASSCEMYASLVARSQYSCRTYGGSSSGLNMSLSLLSSVAATAR